MTQQKSNPWYREPWAWFILTPLIVVVVVCTLYMSVALRHADDTVSDTYYKDSRLYHYSAGQDDRARELNLRGLLKFDRDERVVSLELSGQLQYPESLLLTFSHPVEADRDHHIAMRISAPGRYQGELPENLQHRWYLRVMPEMDPEQHLESDWRLKGEIDFALGDAVPLSSAE